MNARIGSLVMTLMVALGGGCFTMSAKLPGTLRNDVSDLDVQTVGNAHMELTQTYLLWGLVGAPPEDWIERALAPQVLAVHGDGVARLVFESQVGCLDLTITGLTLGCIAPRTYSLRGDVVRWQEVSAPIESPLPPTAPTSDEPARY